MQDKAGYDFVLDCSVTMTWIFEDESSSRTDHILEQLEEKTCVVPSIWPLEVANVLLVAEKKKRIKPIQARAFVDTLSALSIYVDESTTIRAMHSIYALAVSEGLTIYDASYLELALRENIPLATQDKDLMNAAKRLGIKLL